jgi:hypothetical protein
MSRRRPRRRYETEQRVTPRIQQDPQHVALWRVIEIHLFMIEHAIRTIRQSIRRLLT